MFYESRLKVNRRDFPWEKLTGSQCAEITVPKMPVDVDFDIILFATAIYEPY